MIITLSVLLIVNAIALVYYWVDFYTRGGVQVLKENWYIKFQKAFPVADIWAAACSIVCVVGLLTEQPYGLVFALIAASSIIFLGLMDVTFNIQNKLYRFVATSSEMRAELLGNAWFLGLGIALIACLSSRVALD